MTDQIQPTSAELAAYQRGIREGIARTTALMTKRAGLLAEEAKRAHESGAVQAGQRYAIGAEALITFSASVLGFLKQDLELQQREQAATTAEGTPP